MHICVDVRTIWLCSASLGRTNVAVLESVMTNTEEGAMRFMMLSRVAPTLLV